jgi:recombination protein RecT
MKQTKKQEVMETKVETPVIQEQRKLSPKEAAILKFKNELSIYEQKVFPKLLEQHGINPAHFAQIVMSELKRNEKLLEAFMVNPSSMFASVLAGAEIGLIPNEMNGEFYLIPRNLKQSDGRYVQTVTPLIGYKGLVQLMLRSGDVTRIHTEVVYEGDKFEVTYGLEPNLIHVPQYDNERTANKIKYVYAVAKNRSGEYQFAVLTRDEIMKIKAMSRYENDLYFNDAKNINRWMEKKAALVQLSKLLSKDYYSQRAIAYHNSIEGGAQLTLDENNQIKIIEGNLVKPKRFRSIYSEFTNNNLPENNEENEN